MLPKFLFHLKSYSEKFINWLKWGLEEMIQTCNNSVGTISGQRSNRFETTSLNRNTTIIYMFILCYSEISPELFHCFNEKCNLTAGIIKRSENMENAWRSQTKNDWFASNTYSRIDIIVQKKEMKKTYQTARCLIFLSHMTCS